MIFETHAHYDDEAFDGDREELLSSLEAGGVGTVINVCADVPSLEKTAELTERYPFIYGAVGIHPDHVDGLNEEIFEKMRRLCRRPKIVAVGEIGLDYYWHKDPESRALQKEWFQRQLELAREMALPVVVHDREAHADTLAFLQKYRPAGVVHCFSGSWETAREILNLGMYIGLGGVVTFKNARHAVEVAKNIPLDRLVLETDAPYMAPVPFRSKRNDSSLIAYVAEKIGELRGIEPQTLLDCTAENARRLFGIG